MPDTILVMIVAALPGAYLWDSHNASVPNQDDLVVFDGIVPPTPPRRYVAVYIDDGTRDDAESVAHQSTSVTHRWQTTCVAPDRQMAGWLAGRVKDALVDARPVAAGWSPGLIEHTFSQLPRPDELVLERPTVFAVDQFRLLAERIAEPAES
jgi:hypothetical protein